MLKSVAECPRLLPELFKRSKLNIDRGSGCAGYAARSLKPFPLSSGLFDTIVGSVLGIVSVAFLARFF